MNRAAIDQSAPTRRRSRAKQAGPRLGRPDLVYEALSLAPVHEVVVVGGHRVADLQARPLEIKRALLTLARAGFLDPHAELIAQGGVKVQKSWERAFDIRCRLLAASASLATRAHAAMLHEDIVRLADSLFRPIAICQSCHCAHLPMVESLRTGVPLRRPPQYCPECRKHRTEKPPSRAAYMRTLRERKKDRAMKKALATARRSVRDTKFGATASNK